MNPNLTTWALCHCLFVTYFTYTTKPVVSCVSTGTCFTNLQSLLRLLFGGITQFSFHTVFYFLLHILQVICIGGASQNCSFSTTFFRWRHIFFWGSGEISAKECFKFLFPVFLHQFLDIRSFWIVTFFITFLFFLLYSMIDKGIGCCKVMVFEDHFVHWPNSRSSERIDGSVNSCCLTVCFIQQFWYSVDSNCFSWMTAEPWVL